MLHGSEAEWMAVNIQYCTPLVAMFSLMYMLVASMQQLLILIPRTTAVVLHRRFSGGVHASTTEKPDLLSRKLRRTSIYFYLRTIVVSSSTNVLLERIIPPMGSFHVRVYSSVYFHLRFFRSFHELPFKHQVSQGVWKPRPQLAKSQYYYS